ncbi:hypothetical protein F3I62_18825 [Pseudomonas sp. R-28-1W-6]|uniref:hypothetical protein n=1 Tax=Pseudomonas sp. R-28-1W-6 TaxID=2650101 RepID=UPI0013651F24|nr:hypothetical protein [Pseudomonas sp. R-28-1W-6]MWV14159.1 hypothetical protein [Pseudomonas sp. R-28-1W-6]
MNNINEDLSNLEIVKKLDTWSETFTTTEFTPVNSRFVNANGQSIMDLLKADGTTIVLFYREKRDIEAYLKEKGFALDDFKWKSPYGEISIPEARQKINAGEIRVPLNHGHWSLERMLCFAGVTYNHLFNPISKIRYRRITEADGQNPKAALSSLIGGITAATIVLGYSFYFASSMFAEATMTDSNVEDKVKLSEMVVNHAMYAHLPVGQSVAAEPEYVNDASSYVAQHVRRYGELTSGNTWDGVSALSKGIAAQLGKAEVDQDVVNVFLQQGVRISEESCTKIANSNSFNGVGGSPSPLLYAGSMAEQEAIGALRTMVDAWIKTGQVAVPPRGHVAGSFEQLLSFVGASDSPCVASPVMVFRPKNSSTQADESFVLVNLLIRSPLGWRNTQVSNRLFALIQNPANPAERLVRELYAANAQKSMTGLLASAIPELTAKPGGADADAVCQKLDKGDALSASESAAYFERFAQTTPSSALLSPDDLTIWSDGLGLPPSIPVVSLKEFLAHRLEGQCQAEPVVAYELDSPATPYLISAIEKSGYGISRSLVMAYDTGKKEGFGQIPCSGCLGIPPVLAEKFEMSDIKMTVSDLASRLTDEELGIPDAELSDLLDAIARGAATRIMVKKEDVVASLNRELRAAMVTAQVNKTLLSGHWLDKAKLADAVIEKGLVSSEDRAAPFKKNLPIDFYRYSENGGSQRAVFFDQAVTITYDSLMAAGIKPGVSEEEAKLVIGSAIRDQIEISSGIDEFDIESVIDSLGDQKSEMDEAILKIKIADFYNGKIALDQIIGYLHERAVSNDVNLRRISYGEFEAAVSKAIFGGLDYSPLLEIIESRVRSEKH